MAIFLPLMFFLALVSAAHGSDEEHGTLRCVPQNVSLSSVSRELVVSWEDHPSCASLIYGVTYELQALDDPVHREEVVVLADDVGQTHRWTWTSSLPLECKSHAVRIRSRHNNQTSAWTTETLPGRPPSEKIQVLPVDAFFQVGSRATFCCILPEGQTYKSMSLSNYDAPSNTTVLSAQAVALTVDLLRPTPDSPADVICQTETDWGGTCATFGYPPSDGDLRCETRDFQSVQCYWKVGPEINLIRTKYWLLEQPCSKTSERKCSQKVDVDRGERNWTLKAENELGAAELVDRADLTKRVFMFAPDDITASVINARNVTLSWSWTVPRYHLLRLKCQILLQDGEEGVQIEQSGVGLRSVTLNGLIPSWNYTAKVRCATEPDFWKWSDWSKTVPFHTEGDVPEALDVWMHKAKHQTLIMWKFLEDKQSHGQIRDYEVAWRDVKKEKENKISVAHPSRSVALNLSSLKHIIKVAALNEHGRSEPSQIIVVPQPQDLSVPRISGSGGGFSLSWAPVNTSCGYIVEWCPASGNGSVDWLKLPSSDTSANVSSESFKAGVRYVLSVFGCTDDAPLLLERKEGYVQELKIEKDMFKNLRGKQQGSDVEISWDPFPLQEQSAFITGYIVHVQCQSENTVVNFTSDDPQATTITVTPLNITTYSITVCARTAGGECGDTTIYVTLNAQTDYLVNGIIISLVTSFVLFLLITVVCYRHWACIKQKVYPPIPEPVLTGKWLTPHDVLQYCPKEEPTLAISDVHSFLPTSTDGYICQRDRPPAKLTVLPNPVYDLMMRQNSTEYLDATRDDSSDYQPQSILDLICNQTDTDSAMSCVSTYIILPQTT